MLGVDYLYRSNGLLDVCKDGKLLIKHRTKIPTYSCNLWGSKYNPSYLSFQPGTIVTDGVSYVWSRYPKNDFLGCVD